MLNYKKSKLFCALNLMLALSTAPQASGADFISSTATSSALSCSRQAGELTNSQAFDGVANDKNPIEHIIVIMQENHSFDNYFGRLNQDKFYGSQVSGITDQMYNLDKHGQPVYAHHEESKCVADPEHDWNPIHREWNNGKMDGFVLLNGKRAMGYFDERDIPFYYDIANKFAIADNYHSALLTETLPNRFFLYAGTSFGHIGGVVPFPLFGLRHKTIFDSLNEHGVSWKYYKNGIGYLAMFQPMYLANLGKMAKISSFKKDLAKNKLPQVVFIDADFGGQDEHPNGNIEEGQMFVAQRLKELMESSAWEKSVLFLTYDEGGGFFDHEAPPQFCAPDKIQPRLKSAQHKAGGFEQLGFRVPFVAISPYVKHHFVSHQTYDHTAILRFIEDKFKLPALSVRDANSNTLNEMFDFDHPDVDSKPDFDLAKITTSCETEEKSHASDDVDDEK